MKVKHWQGYGIIDAKKMVKQTVAGVTTLVVKVSGNHEWGLIREDVYDLVNWLVKRFDKSFSGSEYRVHYEILDSGTDFKTDDGIEYCVYGFTYRE